MLSSLCFFLVLTGNLVPSPPTLSSTGLRMAEPYSKGQISSDALLPNYTLGKMLGAGSFAQVYLAKHTLTGNYVAVKILNLERSGDNSYAETVRREIQIMRLLSHPHIIRLLEVVEKKPIVYLVMEYMDRGELHNYIVEQRRLQEDEARNIFQQIISGVEFCHLNMVAHRDLKLENILLDSKGYVKLADFGFSNVMRDGHFLKKSCGSVNYAAPEIFCGKHYCGAEIDVWSCGVILYVLLSGRLPFDADPPFLVKIIKNGQYTMPSYFSPGARDLIRRILVVDPITRITASEIRRHPWFEIHLPRYLLVPAEEMRKRMNQIDNDILQEVVDIGFIRHRVIESLYKRIQNQETVTYYLLLDKRSRSYTQLSFGLTEVSEYGTSNLNQQENTFITTRDSLHKQSYQRDTGRSQRLQHPVRRNWALGLQSLACPNDIMREFLNVIQRLNVCWKKIGHYNMKCRWIPNLISSPKIKDPDLNCSPSDGSTSVSTNRDVLRSKNVIKFEIQLYKSSGNRYILDLQILSGSPILFLELCHSVLALLLMV